MEQQDQVVGFCDPVAHDERIVDNLPVRLIHGGYRGECRYLENPAFHRDAVDAASRGRGFRFRLTTLAKPLTLATRTSTCDDALSPLTVAVDSPLSGTLHSVDP